MTDKWVVELSDGKLQSIEAYGGLKVEAGHLQAMQNYGDNLLAAWSPGHWRRFWKRPDERCKGALIARIAVVNALLKDAPDEVTKFYLDEEFARLQGKIAWIDEHAPAEEVEATPQTEPEGRR
jgi:hypothetical protein